MYVINPDYLDMAKKLEQQMYEEHLLNKAKKQQA
jgi:hypothetical protein